MKELRFYLGVAPRNIYEDMIQIVVKPHYPININSMYKVSEHSNQEYLVNIDHVYGLSCYSDVSSVTIVSSVNTNYHILPLFQYIIENTKHTQVKVIDLGKEFRYTLGVE